MCSQDRSLTKPHPMFPKKENWELLKMLELTDVKQKDNISVVSRNESVCVLGVLLILIIIVFLVTVAIVIALFTIVVVIIIVFVVCLIIVVVIIVVSAFMRLFRCLCVFSESTGFTLSGDVNVTNQEQATIVAAVASSYGHKELSEPPKETISAEAQAEAVAEGALSQADRGGCATVPKPGKAPTGKVPPEAGKTPGSKPGGKAPGGKPPKAAAKTKIDRKKACVVAVLKPNGQIDEQLVDGWMRNLAADITDGSKWRGKLQGVRGGTELRQFLAEDVEKMTELQANRKHAIELHS